MNGKHVAVWLAAGAARMATPRWPAETIIPMFAGYVITPIPLILLFTFASRFFIEGLTSGAFKVCAHCYKPVTTPAANPA